MNQSFYLSFVVPDLEAAKAFYVSVLGCSIGRDQGEWADVPFFGHQLTIHQQRDNMVAVTIDHFGPVLTKPEWDAVAA